VLGGLSFGVAWIAALAIAYKYQSHEWLRPTRLARVMLEWNLAVCELLYFYVFGRKRSQWRDYVPCPQAA